MDLLRRPYASGLVTGFGPADCLLGEGMVQSGRGIEHGRLLSWKEEGRDREFVLLPYPKSGTSLSPACPATSGTDPLASRRTDPRLIFYVVGLRRSGLLQKAAPALFAQSVAFAPDGDDVAVVQHSVKDRGGDDRITEDGAPFADSPV